MAQRGGRMGRRSKPFRGDQRLRTLTLRNNGATTFLRSGWRQSI